VHVEARLFEFLTAFFFVAAIAYVILSHEPAGSAALFLTGGLSLIIGTYFRFVARRLEERPEDNPDSEVSDGAGEIGFFSPGSYWPVTLAFAAALMGLSLAFFYIWALVISGVLLIVAIGGLVFEYHLRPSTTERSLRSERRSPELAERASVAEHRLLKGADRWSDRVCPRVI